MSVLKAWDDKHVALIRRKGIIAMDMPKDIMFMPEDKGGYGLTSMVDLLDRLRVEMYLQALNDYSIGEKGEEILSIHANITRLTGGHREKRGTLGYNTSSSANRLGVSVHFNPTSIKRAPQGDLEAALNHPRLRGNQETLDIYTDGITTLLLLLTLEQGYTAQGEHCGTEYSCLRKPGRGLGLEHGCSGYTHM